MPTNPGKRYATRQSQHGQRRRKGRKPALTEAQLRGPSPSSADTSPSAAEPRPEASAPTQPIERERPASPRAIRERQILALQAGPSLVSEVLRIGIVTGAVGAAFIALWFGTTLGT